MKKRHYFLIIIILLPLISYSIMPIVKKEQDKIAFNKTHKAYDDYYLRYQESHHNSQTLPAEKKETLRRLILTYAKQLEQDGWTSQAIQKGFINRLAVNSKAEDFKNAYRSIQIIGSEKFKLLWSLQDSAVTSHQAHANLQLLLKYLRLPNEITNNKIENEQLVRRFDANLSPTDPFWDQLSFLVQLNYNDLSQVTYSPFNQKIHQLRYLISAQQSQWVRRFYQEDKETDAQAFAKYLASLEKEQYILYESSRYHNKVADLGNQLPLYSDNIPQNNYKVLVNFHSEFILSEEGQFLSPLDYQHSNRNSLVNGASFNYANSNNDLHFKLDVELIDRLDPIFIKEAMIEAESKFLEPDLDQQGDSSNPIYSRNGKSSSQLTRAALKKFRKLLRQYQNTMKPN